MAGQRSPLLDPSIPRYRLLSPCFMEDDTLHDEGEEVAYIGTPNEEMEPLNEAARLKVDALNEYLDHHAKLYSDKMGRPFIGRTKDTEEQIAENLKDAKVMSLTRSQVPSRPDLDPKRANKGKDKVLGSKPAPKPQGHGTPVVLGDAYGSGGNQDSSL